jgi:UDP-N-acetylmuramoyl-L-alanyl-D-glutamate--2,6-diaminopimelate ligase
MRQQCGREGRRWVAACRRVEARNALSKLKVLYGITKLKRDTLPWGTPIEDLMESVAADPTEFTRARTRGDE